MLPLDEDLWEGNKVEDTGLADMAGLGLSTVARAPAILLRLLLGGFNGEPLPDFRLDTLIHIAVPLIKFDHEVPEDLLDLLTSLVSISDHSHARHIDDHATLLLLIEIL